MRSLQQWFDEYAVSHQNRTNKLIHWICVPSIFFSVVALLSTVKITQSISLATVALAVAMIFYIQLSWRMSIGIFIFYCLCLAATHKLEHLSVPVWQIALAIFIIAWIGQFIGHKIEGKKPSFLKDLQFLLIGPAWLMGFIYRKVGVPY